MLLPLRWMLFQTEADVTVPDVVGDSEAVATATLEGVGFVVQTTSGYSDTVAVGNVISQSPTGGSEAPEGSTVIIVISLGVNPGGGGGNMRIWRGFGFGR